MKKRQVNIKVLIICLVVVYATAFIGSLFTSADTEWYNQIKPSITPPNYIFPIVWNILFFLIGLSLYFAWMKAKPIQKKLVAEVFAVNLIFNIVWSILYFGLHNVLYAFIEIFILWISIVWMIIVTWKIDKKAAYLLVPYLLWVSFAIILNYLSIKLI